ncbi:MAG: hypothetical protein JSW05_11790 [Candidatus Thorarchaeota archaeon]|nr:MAG: hypothetical protein AM324_12580 [Candidatus Thorarchaeota archaeon SMTZ1-83]UCH04240.1 MAG: hypothetical protein JSW05_11790 [Candidatus Thorarchaeota archaeon]
MAGADFEAFEDLRESLDTFIERWSKIQRNSVKSIQAVTNTLVQIEHIDGPLGKLEGLQNIRENARGKLLVNLFDKLVPALEASIKEFTKLMKMFETLRHRTSSLQTITETLREEGVEDKKLDSLVGFLDLIVLSIQDILDMFESEWLIKATIFRDLEEGGVELGVITNYLTMWSVEPNIEPHALEKLMKDLDEHFDLLRDIFQGKTGIQLPDFYRKVSF